MANSSLNVLSKYIPGFGAYQTEQKRRDDDVAVRKYIAERLQECKRDLQTVLSTLLEQANFSAITQGEKLRASIDFAQSKIRAAVEGYSSWFDATRVDEAKLKQVVDLDNDLVGVVDRLQSEIKKLAVSAPDFQDAQGIVANLKERFSRRSELLSK